MSFLEIYYSIMRIFFLFITDMMLSASRLPSVCKICDSNGRTFAVLRTQMSTSQNLDPRRLVRQTDFCDAQTLEPLPRCKVTESGLVRQIEGINGMKNGFKAEKWGILPGRKQNQGVQVF